jgi:putative cell wall-binding protein
VGTAVAAFEHQFPAAASTPASCPASHAVVLASRAAFSDALSSAYLAGVLGTGTLLTDSASLSPTAATAIRREGIAHVYVVGGPLAVSTTVLAQLRAMQAYACGGTTPLGTDLNVVRVAGASEYATAERIALVGAALASSGASSPAAGGGVGTANLSAAYATTNASGGAGLYDTTWGNGSPKPPPAGALPTAILVAAGDLADLESASAIAYAAHLPILLTVPYSLAGGVMSTIEALGIKQVILIGGPLVVHGTAVAELGAGVAGPALSVLRIAGRDAGQTAVELARCELASASAGLGMGWSASRGVVVAGGGDSMTALGAALVPGGGPSGASPEPLLLTATPGVPGAALVAFLEGVGAQAAVATGPAGVQAPQLTILGGAGSVTQTAALTLAVALVR